MKGIRRRTSTSCRGLSVAKPWSHLIRNKAVVMHEEAPMNTSRFVIRFLHHPRKAGAAKDLERARAGSLSSPIARTMVYYRGLNIYQYYVRGS